MSYFKSKNVFDSLKLNNVRAIRMFVHSFPRCFLDVNISDCLPFVSANQQPELRFGYFFIRAS